jgi:hypothetical protein
MQVLLHLLRIDFEGSEYLQMVAAFLLEDLLHKLLQTADEQSHILAGELNLAFEHEMSADDVQMLYFFYFI